MAPPVKVGTIVQGGPISEHLGRAQLIEFWAASCPACVNGIPHLNELARQFRDRPIDFLSVNPEEGPEIIRKFIQVHPMEGVIATDQRASDGNPSTASAYRLEAVPVTILVAKDGRVAAIGSPEQITPEVLERVLADKPVILPATDRAYTMAIPKHQPFIGSWSGNDDSALVNLLIAPTVKESALITAPAQIESEGANLRTILSYAYDISSVQIVIPELIEKENYQLRIWVPSDSPQLLRPLLQDAVAAAAAIRVRKQTKEMDVLLLDGLPGKLTLVPESTMQESSCRDHQIEGRAITLQTLTRCLESVTKRVVVIPSESNSRYSMKLTWDGSQPSDLETALRQQLGLSIRHAKREVDTLIVEPAQQ
ncbi:MAG: TIGR03435 family protein [Acidobacteriaceae bacterium]|nr:TIGR03435 family protein [Acidobacteriaceae bacterium]